MDLRLIQIFKAAQTLHDLEKEFSTFIGKFRFLDKLKYKKLKRQLIEYTNELYKEEWSVEYLHKMEKSLEAFYLILQNFFGKDLYIQNFPNSSARNNNTFHPIYFRDLHNPNRMIRLEIISDNISFKIIDSITGNSFTVSANYSVQEDQKQIEAVCKHCLITIILKFINQKYD